MRAFRELADAPESVDVEMPRLTEAAATIADDACDWAAQCNANFNPASVDDGVTRYIVISDIDGISPVFFIRESANQYAKVAYGSVFLLVAAEEDDRG